MKLLLRRGLRLLSHSLAPTHTNCGKGGTAMRNGGTKNGAAALAWEMFEKTGSIAYYMLFLELNNGNHHG